MGCASAPGVGVVVVVRWSRWRRFVLMLDFRVEIAENGSVGIFTIQFTIQNLDLTPHDCPFVFSHTELIMRAVSTVLVGMLVTRASATCDGVNLEFALLQVRLA